MKILHLISQRPDSTGSGIYLNEVLKQSQKAGHDNYLIAALPFGETPPKLPIKAHKCSFIRFENDELNFPITGMSNVMPYNSTRFDQLTEDQLSAYKNSFNHKLEKVLKEKTFDIIHSHHLWLFSSIAKLSTDISVITSCHGSDLRQFKSFSGLRTDVLAGCQKLDHILALSDDQKNDIASTYKISKDKISVVGAGVNSDIFKTEPSVQNQSFQIIYAGKLSKSKGVPYLLQAIIDLVKEQPELDINIKLAGDSPSTEGKECLQLVEELGTIAESLGRINQTQLAEQLNKADLFILPSLFEGLPLVVLEALACNCPVLATELPGVKEIASKVSSPHLHTIPMPKLHNIDEVIDADNFTENIKNKIHEIITLNHNKNKISIDGISYFTWQNVFKRIEKVYAETLS